jgi:acyl carrier protein
MGLFGKKKTQPPQAPADAPPVAKGAAPTSAAAIQEELCQALARLADGTLAPEAIDPAGHMFDLGYLDSFRSAEFLVFIERRFAVQVPELELVGRLCNVEALSRHLARGRIEN